MTERVGSATECVTAETPLGGRRGLSLVGVIAAVACVIVIVVVVILVLVVPRSDPRQIFARTLRDATQVKQIHQAMLVWSNDNEGRLPVPGLIDRLADPFTRRHVPGTGPEDIAQNTTANLFSTLIAQEFFNPDLVISSLERSAFVTEMLDYDYTAWNPEGDSYWDPRFVADLVTGSNTSYGHTPLAGVWWKVRWRDTADGQVALVGHRGPADGIASANSSSCQSSGRWAGAIVFGDNHTDYASVPKDDPIRLEHLDTRDNPFAVDEVLGARDAFIVFTRRMSEGKPEIQHD